MAAGTQKIAQGTLERLGTGGAAMPTLLGLVGRTLRRVRLLHRLLQLGRAGGHLALQPGGGRLERRALVDQQVGPDRRRGVALLERGHPVVQRRHVLLLARHGPFQGLGARPHLGEGALGRVVTPHGRPALPQRRLLAVQVGLVALEPGLSRIGLRLVRGGGDLGRQARRFGLESGHDIHIGRRIERRRGGPQALPEHAGRPPGPLDQALDASERPGEVLLAMGGQLGRGGRRLGIERLEGGVELALLFVADGQALGGGAPATRQLGQFHPGQVAPNGQELGGDGVVRPGGRGLALEGADLASHLAHQIPQPLQVLGRGRQPPFGTLAAAAVLEHAGRLLNDGPAVFGPGIEHGVELTLADDHVLLAADARVREQLLHVEQPAGRAVNGVLAVAGAEQRARDRDLGEVDGQLARGVVDGQGDLGPAQRRAGGRPGEDDVLHLGRSERAGALGPEHPGDRIDHVGFATPIGPDHHGDPRLELQHGGVGERLESLHAERLQEHRGDPTGPGRSDSAIQTWQCSQKKVERPPVLTRTITLRHRRHACPSRS